MCQCEVGFVLICFGHVIWFQEGGHQRALAGVSEDYLIGEQGVAPGEQLPFMAQPNTVGDHCSQQ